MNHKTFALIVLSALSCIDLYSQTQIGNNVNGISVGDVFGSNTAISSDGSIIAAAGSVGMTGPGGSSRVFQNVNGVWTLYGTDINGENFGNLGSASISLSADGDTFANTVLGETIVRVFAYDDVTGIWNQKGSDIINNTSVGRYGYSIKLSADGNIIAIGAPDSPIVPTAGVTQVLQYNSGSWNQIGNDIVGVNPTEHSGRSVDLSSDGNTVAIMNDNSARVYESDSGTWTLVGNEIPAVGGQSPNRAVSLSADGTVLAIGEADFTDSLIQRGRVRVFRNVSGSWNQIGNAILGEVAYYRSGWSVNLSGNGDLLVIGEPGSTSGSTDEGRTRIFQNVNDSWIQIGNSILGDDIENYSGRSVVISGDGTTLISGAPFNDDNGVDSGQIKVFSISSLLSTEEFESEQIKIFPNPSKHQFSVVLPPSVELEKIAVYNSLGRLIMTSTHNVINTSNLSSGLYVVEIKFDQSRIIRKVLID